MKIIFLSILFISSYCFGKDHIHNEAQMIDTINIIKNSFQVLYAPTEWKQSYVNWDLNKEIDIVKGKIYSNPNLSVKDFQKILVDFFKSTKDYHVGVDFYSTESAYLPIRIKSAEGRFFITQIDRERISYEEFPYCIGDEVLKFDGINIKKVVEELKVKAFGSPCSDTDQALAEMYLTIRVGALGQEVPNGTVSLEIKSSRTSKVFTAFLDWVYAEEKILERNLVKECKFQNPELAYLFRKTLQAPFHKSMMKTLSPYEIEDIENSDSMGARKSFIPDLGNKIWESEEENPFHAYLFETTDRKVGGYIRIPHYNGYSEDVKEFAKLIAFLEKNSDVLVIDQVNNPGGSLFYLYSLISMLGDRPFVTPNHKIKITQNEVMAAVSSISMFELIENDEDAQFILGEDLEGFPVTYELSQKFLNYFRFIESQWNQGKTFTDPYPLYGVDVIYPHSEVKYTKPILLLTNCMDFSGGDFFAAIMQDNERVTVLGEKTAGAGGFVVTDMFPNFLGIQDFSYTASLAERKNKNPTKNGDVKYIENLGVKPDVAYKISVKDLMKNYVEYVHFIQKEINKLSKKG